MSVAISALLEQLIKTTNTFDDGTTFSGTIESITKNGFHTLTHAPTGDSGAIFTPWMSKVHVDLSSGAMRDSDELNSSHGIAAYKYFLLSGTGNWSQQFADESKLESSNTGTGDCFSFYKVATDTVTGTITTVIGMDCDLDLDALSLTYTNAYALYAPQDEWDIKIGGTITAGKYNIGTPTELTMTTTPAASTTAGQIVITGSYHSVDTEGDVASDDLRRIEGGVAGDILYLFPANEARTVVVKTYVGTDSGGDTDYTNDNIALGGADFSLDSTSDILVLLYNGAVWTRIINTSNGG